MPGRHSRAYLRREGIYSSQLYAWRRERDSGELYPQTLTRRKDKRAQEQELERRNQQLEVENRKLQRRIARLELFEKIRKKAAGALEPGVQEPRVRRERLIDAAVTISSTISERATCSVLGVSRSTVRRRNKTVSPISRSSGERKRPSNALTEVERETVLGLLNSDCFCDLAAPQVFAQLLDDGIYLCSVSTMYRLLRLNAQVRERRRLARHPDYIKPKLVAMARPKC